MFWRVECSYKFDYLNEMNLHTRIAGHLFRRYFYGKIFRKMFIPRKKEQFHLPTKSYIFPFTYVDNMCKVEARDPWMISLSITNSSSSPNWRAYKNLNKLKANNLHFFTLILSVRILLLTMPELSINYIMQSNATFSFLRGNATCNLFLLPQTIYIINSTRGKA